jgi:serine/threonine protein kinase
VWSTRASTPTSGAPWRSRPSAARSPAGRRTRASAAARFRNEAQAAGRLTHPGIVAVYEFGIEHETSPTSRWSSSRATRWRTTWPASVRFTDEDIPGVICQLLDALDHAHDQGVWHRDIKPANIIMARNGKLKIADFGIARIEDAALTQSQRDDRHAELHGARAVPRHARWTRRVDLYATGVLLYLLLTGRPPFTGTPSSCMYKVVHEAAKSCPARCPMCCIARASTTRSWRVPWRRTPISDLPMPARSATRFSAASGSPSTPPCGSAR